MQYFTIANYCIESEVGTNSSYSHFIKITDIFGIETYEVYKERLKDSMTRVLASWQGEVKKYTTSDCRVHKDCIGA